VNVTNYEGYKDLNAKAWDWVMNNKESAREIKFGINEGRSGMKMINEL
jgi:hypothetical protein